MRTVRRIGFEARPASTGLERPRGGFSDLGHALDSELLDQPLDLTHGDAIGVHLHHDAEQRVLRALPRLPARRRVAAGRAAGGHAVAGGAAAAAISAAAVAAGRRAGMSSPPEVNPDTAHAWRRSGSSETWCSTMTPSAGIDSENGFRLMSVSALVEWRELRQFLAITDDRGEGDAQNRMLERSGSGPKRRRMTR
jgi:hypothetical protein